MLHGDDEGCEEKRAGQQKGEEFVGRRVPYSILFLRRSPNKEHHQATSIFCTSDLVGRHYVGVVLASRNQLWMISCSDDVAKGKPQQLVSMATIAGCREAAPLSRLSMMLVLDDMGGLSLYSGLHKVGVKEEWSCGKDVSLQMKTLDLQSIPASRSAVAAGIAHPIEDSFTVSFGSGVLSRCALPFPATLHPISTYVPQ